MGGGVLLATISEAPPGHGREALGALHNDPEGRERTAGWG